MSVRCLSIVVVNKALTQMMSAPTFRAVSMNMTMGTSTPRS